MVLTSVTDVDTNCIMSKYLINIVGPTAIGKTALSIKLAQHFNTEIISSDSRQFYKEMTIGTAVPSKEELASAKHHFIQHISVKDDYSVGNFEVDALKTIKKVHQTNDYVIMVGGSGLYSKAVTNGLDEFPAVDKKVRENLNTILKSQGIVALQQQLKNLDPLAYNNIAIDNPQRVIRALEICLGTEKPYSAYLTKTSKKRNFKTISIGLNAEREIIYDRINKRVDIMVENGLLDEAKQLLPYKHLNALNTVGYKELFKYFEGKWDLDFAISEIKKNTRRFAKRQLTWNRKNDTIKWFDYMTLYAEIAKHINGIVEK